MTLEELEERCRLVQSCGEGATRVSLAPPKGWRPPKGFPRGELLCETQTGRVYSYPVDRLLAWVKKTRAEVQLS